MAATKNGFASFFTFSVSDDIVKYKKISELGEGTFGKVFKCESDDHGVVAVKKIHTTSPRKITCAIREINLLHHLKHKNIVSLIEVVCCSDRLYAVLEYCRCDLAKLIYSNDVNFDEELVQSLMEDLLEGLMYVHQKNIMHRDLKPENILVGNDGAIKIADFGGAKYVDPSQKDTALTGTIWYMAPEVLLGEKLYTSAVDMWSVGCIFFEMWFGKPLMMGTSQQAQLILISQLCGPINSMSYPGLEDTKYGNAIKLPQNCKRLLSDKLSPMQNKCAKELIEGLLEIDAKKRPSAEEVLKSNFFSDCDDEESESLISDQSQSKCLSDNRHLSLHQTKYLSEDRHLPLKKRRVL